MGNALGRFVCIFTVLGSVAAQPVQAQDNYPSKPIRMIVGFAAGGPTDIPARFIAEKLGDRLGQRVVVENKPAAGGMLATREVLAQPKDGYTLLLCTHFESINVAVYKNPQYKLADIAPISLVSQYFYGIGLSNVVPATDMASFTTYAKAHPGEISYGTMGLGSAQEIFARQLERLAGITMNRVPYRSGTQLVQDMIPGRVQFYVAPMAQLIPLLADKQAKILGVSSTQRLKSAPQVATLQEQGIDFVRFGWLGLCTNTGTPQPVIDLLNRHITEIVATPDYQALTERAGSIPISSTPAELRRVIDQTLAEVQGTVQEFGLQQE